MEDPKGTIVFSTVGRSHYGFDVFTLDISSPATSERRLTDGVSINFNAQFVDHHRSIVFISERTGSPQIYLLNGSDPELLLPSVPASPFHDRPVVKNGRVYFVSAHEETRQHFKSSSAVYTFAAGEEVLRLTPPGEVDYSPAVSESGELVAVAAYGSRHWDGEFHEVNTQIAVFKNSDPSRRFVVADRGGWPTWCGDSTVYFHRPADDGWWSIFRVDLDLDLDLGPGDKMVSPRRVTPAGVHCFTPAAMNDGKRIAVATRRRGSRFRHIEMFDLESGTFHPLTQPLNPDMNHYNPFVSPDSQFVGYHRFRGGSAPSGLTVPHLEPVTSPVDGLRMVRLNGFFPSYSPDGSLIAFNRDLDGDPGVMIVKSDGSKRWAVPLRGRATAFCTSWSPTEKHVIYTSVGPIFQSANTTVQIARISFDPSSLADGVEIIPIDLKILTREDTGNNAFPSCSPDGKSIVFRSGRTGHKNLYLVDAVNGEFDGGYVRQLTDGPWIDTMPSWSPRGDLIAFSSNMHNPENGAAFSIYVVRPDGSGLRRIEVAGGCVDRERINHVCFSSDGEWLLFTANLGGLTAEPVSWPNQFQPYGDLYVVRLDGSGLRRLTCDGYENGTPAWHSEMGLGGLRLEVGEKLGGQFDEPLWISCDI